MVTMIRTSECLESDLMLPFSKETINSFSFKFVYLMIRALPTEGTSAE